ncbi:MAG: polyketide cyclase [Cyclobacteriaceae bacterium]|nr:polyketide cyclase [Cyclobacteriaceae bacterium]
METTSKNAITVEATVKAPVEKVWKLWSEPNHIMKWNSASDDWHTPAAENDLRTNGKFKSTMAARDGSMSFDFEGVYSNVVPHKVIEYGMGDGRKVKVTFASNGNETKVVETFDPESINSVEMQRGGWQAILNSFKKYAEAN